MSKTRDRLKEIKNKVEARKVEEKVEAASEGLAEMTEVAYDIVGERKEFKLVTIRYNPKTMEAFVESLEDLKNRDVVGMKFTKDKENLKTLLNKGKK